MSKTLTLIAVGNSNMADDGIALLLLESMQEQLPDSIDYYFWDNVDALTMAADLLQIQTPLVIMDCADMGLEGGEFRWFNYSQHQLHKHFELLSTHGFGFSEALALVQQLGFKQELYFFAVQPLCLKWQKPVSRLLDNSLPQMMQELLKHLQPLVSTA